MADTNVKTVNVQVETGSTEHALLTGGTKKTRRRRNANSSPPTPAPASVGDVAAAVPSTKENATTAAVKVTKMTEGAGAAASLSPTSLSPQASPASPAQAKPAALGPPQPPQAAPVTVPPPAPPAPVPAVKIAPKNGGGQAPPTPAPRLLPKKRIGTAPAAETLKAKPKFVVDATAAPATEDSQKGGTLAADAPTSGTNRSAVGGARLRTRRAFKERRISLTVQPVKKSRKYRRTLRARVAEMPLHQVRRMLLRKGVMKPKKDTEKAPPEEMMRSMLVDYMMLHHAD